MAEDESTGESGPIVVARVLDAPRERVWKAWTDPERVKCWWGPEGFTSPVARIDLRPGGTYLYAMRSPEGQDFWTTGTYREIVERERIVATQSFADAEGTVVPAAQYGLPGDWAAEPLITIVLEERDGRTAMTVREDGIPAEVREMAELGLRQSIEKLAACLARA